VALQLPKDAGPVPAELRTPQPLPRLRRRTLPRPDRVREREACTPYPGLRWSWQKRAAMIDPPRRHGHDLGRSPRQRYALLSAVAADDGLSIHRWENEGGSYSMTDELDLEVHGCEKPSAGLDRSAVVAPSISHRGRTGHA
jgi:hypothetical protein